MLLLSLCGICRAEPARLSLPRWTEIDEHACYDLEGAKALKIFEVDCRALESKFFLLEEKLSLLVEKSVAYSALAISCTAQKNALAALNVSAEKAIVDLQADLTDERLWSLRDGALLYVIVGAVVLVAAAGVAGYELNEALQ